MSYDPLSRSTRSSKRMLLLVVVLAFLIDLFHIALTDLPLGGFETRVDPGVLPLFVFIIVLYFTISFAIAIFDDVANTPTPHVLEIYNAELLSRLYAGLSDAEKQMTERLSGLGLSRGPALSIARNITFKVKNDFPEGVSPAAIAQIVHRPLDEEMRAKLPEDIGEEFWRVLSDVVAPVVKDYRKPRIGAYLQFFYARLYGFELALPAALALATLYLYFRKIDLAWLGLFTGGAGS
ncbi:MAG TPA: hypothetical protein VKA19_15495 [Alphaproteobacteria bacterium]|nr:hypothetical protein [Alphaproteobacteria bacterium]